MLKVVLLSFSINFWMLLCVITDEQFAQSKYPSNATNISTYCASTYVAAIISLSDWWAKIWFNLLSYKEKRSYFKRVVFSSKVDIFVIINDDWNLSCEMIVGKLLHYIKEIRWNQIHLTLLCKICRMRCQYHDRFYYLLIRCWLNIVC